MPQHLYETRYGIAGTAGEGMINPQIGGAGGEALTQAARQVGSATAELSAQMVRGQQAIALTRATTAATRSIDDLSVEVQKDPDWVTAADRFEKGATEIQQKQAATITDPTVRTQFDAHFKDRIETHRIAVRTKATEIGHGQAKAALEDALTVQSQAAAEAPNEIARGEALAAGAKSINDYRGVWHDDLQATRYAAGFKQRVDQADALKMIRTDPAGAATALTDATKFPNLEIVQRENLTRMAENRANSLLSERRGVVSRRLDDEVASIRETGGGIGVTPAEVRGAYKGADADAILKSLQKERDFYQARAGVATNTPEQDTALLAELTPKGEGFKAAAERRDLVAKAIYDKRVMLLGKPGTTDLGDPAGYVLQNSPEIRAMVDRTAKNPQELPQALAALDDAQARLGVPPERRRVMTTAQATATAQKIGALPAEEAANNIQQLATQYGDQWGAVWRDLVSTKQMPPDYRVLATVDNPAARVALAQTLRMNRDDLKKTAGAENVKEIDAGLDQTLERFRATLSQTPDRESVYADYRDATQRLAYRYSATQAPADALRAAAAHVVNDKYDFAAGTTFSARTPKGRLAAAEDTGDRIREALKPEDLAPQQGGRNLTDDQTRAAWLSSVKSNGLWVTNKNDTGWILLDAVRNPVQRQDGSAVEFLFKDATEDQGKQGMIGIPEMPGHITLTPELANQAPAAVFR